MLIRSLCSVLSIAFWTAALPAAFISGDPAADGWQASGNSLANGNYIRGSGNFGFTHYSSSFSLSSSAAGDIGSANWNAGDQILGIGGIISDITPAAAGWPAFTGDAVNANLTSSARISVKFGVNGGGWQASAIAPGAGDGLGSFSGGNGGIGSIILGTNTPPDVLANPGTLQTVALAQRYDGSVSAINMDIGRFIFQHNGGGLLQSWQVLLNVTYLNQLNGLNGDALFVPGRVNQSLQRGSGVFTDSLVNPVPLPPTLLIAGLPGLLFLIVRRRRSAELLAPIA